MWGGRFNPIVLVDRDEAAQLVELYRADVIVPVGDREDVKKFPKRFPHLIDPFFPSALYVRDGRGRTLAQVLDIQNALYHWHKTPEWKAIDTQGVRQFVFDTDIRWPTPSWSNMATILTRTRWASTTPIFSRKRRWPFNAGSTRPHQFQ
jgi:hypothetical protein